MLTNISLFVSENHTYDSTIISFLGNFLFLLFVSYYCYVIVFLFIIILRKT